MVVFWGKHHRLMSAMSQAAQTKNDNDTLAAGGKAPRVSRMVRVKLEVQ